MNINVPFLRPHLGEEEINEVVETLRSGWLTSGPRVKRFETEFAEAVKAKFAVALNSCTAALHLAVDALGLSEGQAVLVPTMTFAATAEIVLYKKAIPILVDCDPVTGNMDLADAERKIEDLRQGRLPDICDKNADVVGIIPVHVGGLMMDIRALQEFAEKHGLWIVEDAAHAFPAAWREQPDAPWQRCGENTARVTCYSFYANKTITTGEGGMAVTDDQALADRIRLMSLHGLSNDAWGRFSGKGAWDYQIVSPGYKYNLTDIAAAVGVHQLARAEEMRRGREKVAQVYFEHFSGVEEMDLPPRGENRIHAWHLYPVRLKLANLSIDRNAFMEKLKMNGVGCSVNWRPLHLHPLYAERFGWRADHLPAATTVWEQLISLPIFSSMSDTEIDHVRQTVTSICRDHAVRVS